MSCDCNHIIEEPPPILEMQAPPIIEILGGPPGPSAYEIARRAGFTGTLDEWLNMLRSPAAAVLSSSCLVAFTPGGLIRADGPSGIAAQGWVRSAAAIGDECLVYRIGTLTGFAGLTRGQSLYLGAAGQIITAPPSAGLYQIVGTAAANDTAAMEIETPFFL